MYDLCVCSEPLDQTYRSCVGKSDCICVCICVFIVNLWTKGCCVGARDEPPWVASGRGEAGGIFGVAVWGGGGGGGGQPRGISWGRCSYSSEADRIWNFACDWSQSAQYFHLRKGVPGSFLGHNMD